MGRFSWRVAHQASPHTSYASSRTFRTDWRLESRKCSKEAFISTGLLVHSRYIGHHLSLSSFGSLSRFYNRRIGICANEHSFGFRRRAGTLLY